MITSKKLMEVAEKIIPAGVNSPVRAFRGVGGSPLFIRNGDGPYIYDMDNNQYIDFVCSWGPLIVGHAHPFIIEKVIKSIDAGLSFGAPTEVEVQLAQKINEFIPSLELIRFVNSGTEASMSAIRLARGFTKRNKIIKFAGCYHGHSDSLLIAAGSGGLTFGIPSSAGVPESIAQETLVASFNRLDEVENLFKHFPNDIAAVIVEPIAGNMNLVLPKPGFLNGLRELCDRYNAILIFDEIITGFRVGLGGAQREFDITPDLTLLGKIIGGGFPAAAFGGRADIMKTIAPLGPVYQAGTLSGNPVAMTAGLATLELVSMPHFYQDLAAKTLGLTRGLEKLAKAANIPFKATAIGGMFGLLFTENDCIETEDDVKRCNMKHFLHFFHEMLAARIYLAPSPFEIGFVSSVHSDLEMKHTLKSAKYILDEMD